MLGIYAAMNNLYRVTFNHESGNGRYDIQMKPYDLNLPSILIELKVPRDKIADHVVETTLIKLAEEECQISLGKKFYRLRFY